MDGLNTPWTKVDRDSVVQTVELNVRGVDVVLDVAPYDVPEAQRAYTVGHDHVFEFLYLGGDEAEERLRLHEDLDVFLGKHSRRVLKIVVRSVEDNARVKVKVTRRAHEALSEIEDRQLGRRVGNYRAAHSALLGCKDTSLLEMLPA